MLNVGAVLKHISSQKYQLSPVLLTLHNYLQHLAEPEDAWNSSLLDRFFRDCLVYPHWVQNRVSLAEEVRSAGLGFQETYWPDKTQILEIEEASDFSDVVNAHLTFQYQKTGSKFRLINENEKLLCAVILHLDQSVSVRQFDRKFILREGQLEPLRADLEVHYTPELDLEPDLAQKLEVAPFVTAWFTPHLEGADATLVRGYIFQKFHEFKAQPLESYPRLFYTLKRLEQFFVRRESDPFYRRLNQDLERALHQLRLGEPVDSSDLTDLQVRAQNALEYVFTGDRMLGLLLRELESQMANSSRGKQRSLQGNLGHLNFVEDTQENPWPRKKKTFESDLTS